LILPGVIFGTAKDQIREAGINNFVGLRADVLLYFAGSDLMIFPVSSWWSASPEQGECPNSWSLAITRTITAGLWSEATVSLDEALKASEREGKPLSAKYEIENGAFQLSVYVVKGNGFAEVIVDPKGGGIKKTEPITDSDDLQEAKEQQQRLAHARIPLDRAVTDAVKDNSGYRAVEIEPTVDRAGKPVASVTLMKGDEVKNVVEPLEWTPTGGVQSGSAASTGRV
jgi:hypothetical protein